MKLYLIAFFLLFAQFAHAQKNAAKPFILGETIELKSKILSEKRILNIYLPEGYNESDTTRYPVVYLLDGAADEDFIHVVGLYQFNNFSWINRVPKSIVVGIANVDRKRDFTFPTSMASQKKMLPSSGKSARFISFLENELQAFIEKNYRCSGFKSLIGQSLAGLFATEVLLTKPELFDHYMIISPSIWWNNASILSKDIPSGISKVSAVYIGVGKEGVTPGENPRVMEVDANLLADKIRNSSNKNLKVYFDYLPEENHATVTHQALFNALRLLYPVEK